MAVETGRSVLLIQGHLIDISHRTRTQRSLDNMSFIEGFSNRQIASGSGCISILWSHSHRRPSS